MHSVFIQNLKKSYGDQKVLDGINLIVEEGEFYALMGPNGSGKSTLSSIIASVTKFDSGILEIHGKKPAACFAIPRAGCCREWCSVGNAASA